MSGTIELLATCAPKFRKAVRDAKKAGHVNAFLDGELIPINRVAADRPFYGTPRPRQAPSRGKRANARSKAWKSFTKLRCRPWRARKLAKAVHALQPHEAQAG